MRVILSLFLGAACALLAAGCNASETKDLDPNAPNAVPAAFVQDNNRFAFDLYDKAAVAPGNLFFSPHSISTALAMTYAGARNVTREQMRTVLRFSGEDSPLHAGFATLLGQLAEAGNRKGCTLRTANRLWSQEGYPFAGPFLELTRTSYGAEAVTVDYRSNPGAAISAINDWVAKATEKKIQNIVGPDSIKKDTRLVLTNAIYFKGDWKQQFKPSATKVEPFFTAPNTKLTAQLMHQIHEFRYTETDALQAVELPYLGRLSMVVVLPKKIDGLPALEQTLAIDGYEKWLTAMRTREVDLFLPRFRMEYEINLTDTLIAMGMPDAFGMKADFSGMADQSSPIAKEEPLYLSAVLHKAFVDVNEEGTEAAAATAVVMTKTAVSIPAPPVVFRADHPFLFLIRDMRSGSILFLGRLVNPA